jgi:hypothetical protein
VLKKPLIIDFGPPGLPAPGGALLISFFLALGAE